MMRLCILLAWIAGVSQIGVPIGFALWPWSLIIAVITVMLLLLIWLRLLHVGIWLRYAILTCCTAAVFSLGHAYANQQLLQRMQYREQQVAKASVIIFVDHMPQKSQLDHNTWQQSVQVLDRHAQVVRWRMQYPVQSTQSLKLGHYYRVQGKILPTHGYAVEGVFNQELWMLQQQYMASFQLELLQPLIPTQFNTTLLRAYVKQHQQFLAVIQRQIEAKRWALRQWLAQQSYQQTGLLLALLSGDQSLLSTATQQQFKQLGILHLLAISGPHVLIFALMCCALLGGVIRFCCPTLFLYWARADLYIWPFVICVWWYCAFVGFEIPALRSLITANIVSSFLLLKQPISPSFILLLSGSILLLFDPLNILSAAFWLSYSASLILLHLYFDRYRHGNSHQHFDWLGRLFRNICSLIMMHWKIFLALLPLTVFIFQQFSWLSPVANLIAVPMIGALIVPLTIIANIFYPLLPELANVIFHLADLLLQLLIWILSLLQPSQANILYAPALQPLQILGLTLGIIALFIPHGVLPRLWIGLCSLLTLYSSQQPAQFELTVIDVGQGQALLLNTAGKHLMIDIGGHYQERQWGIGAQVISPFLIRQGITQLDQLIISHLDQDHRGGLSSLSKQIKIKQIVSNQYDDGFVRDGFADTPFQYCQRGQSWHYENIRIEILSPAPEQLAHIAENKNEGSCVVYIEVPQAQGWKRFLIMGDAGWQTEYQIMQDYPDLQVDVLVLGHHGSKHSSAYAFLQWLQPQLALVSAGWNNRYGHPHPIVLQRLKALSIALRQTSQDGSIRFELTPQRQMQMTLQRDQRLWLRH